MRCLEQTADEIGHTAVLENNPNKEAYRSRREIEEHQEREKLEELWPSWYQSSHWINDRTEYYWWDKA